MKKEIYILWPEVRVTGALSSLYVRDKIVRGLFKIIIYIFAKRKINTIIFIIHIDIYKCNLILDSHRRL